MKLRNAFFTTLFISTSVSLFAQTWTRKADFSGQERLAATGFSNGGFGYVCAGSTNNTNHFFDLWEYNPNSDSWTAKASFPGVSRRNLISFTIDSLSYVGLGFNYSQNIVYKDFYSYNPSTNSWSSLAPFPGNLARGSKASSLNGKGYVFGGGNGIGASQLSNQTWEYDPIQDSWTQKATFPFAARTGGLAFTFDSLVYFGFGHNTNTAYNDLWAYNPNSNLWVQKNSFPGTARYNASVFVLNGKVIVGGGSELTGGIGTPYPNDYYIYDPIADSWTLLPTFSKGARATSATFSLGNKGYIIAGQDSAYVSMKDVWEYSDTTIVTGINQVDYSNDNSIIAYPNPTRGKIFFSNLKKDMISVRIFDSRGVLVLNKDIKTFNENYDLDLSSFSNGIYFFQLETTSLREVNGKILLKK